MPKLQQWRLNKPDKVAEAYSKRVVLPNSGQFKKQQFTEEQINAIKTDKRSSRIIASEYNTNRSTIQRIRNNHW